MFFAATAAVCALKMGMLLATEGGTSFTLTWFIVFLHVKKEG